ncbi:unnamed protein product, partial [Ectocarpus fasciculatus]
AYTTYSTPSTFETGEEADVRLRIATAPLSSNSIQTGLTLCRGRCTQYQAVLGGSHTQPFRKLSVLPWSILTLEAVNAKEQRIHELLYYPIASSTWPSRVLTRP